ncbi:HNH endonuclease signature motif containing protein, partial [Nocardioides sp.]|uniref:HNH endonuclease signature motif containing protein n=1 Tax=Nocardioides sp. TaxID=35761 RepID=UPI0027251E15
QRLDPEGADAREAAALQRQEARARKKTRFSMGDDGHGMTHGRFSIPTLYGDMLRKALMALAAPKHVRAAHGAGSYDWKTPTAERMGQAFCDYIARFPAKLLPKLGGLDATIIVIGDAGLLDGKVKAARLDTGTRISHTEYLRMACEAGIVPMWMNASGEVLSVGRLYRLHTTRQRLVLIVERQHCEATGCQVPGWLCHVHHRIPWSQGGTTDTTTAQLLCPFHHHRAHATGDTHPQRE